MEQRYWDSDCFLGWLNDEPDKVDECRTVLEGAKGGRILLVTSALTLAEVVKLKGRTPIPKEDAEKIRGFFKQPFIAVRDVERYIAENAQDLLWTYPRLQPKDAIHVATATRLHLTLFNTFDQNLINLSGSLGHPRLVIARPSVAQQPLPLAD